MQILSELRRFPDEDPFYVFYDANQRIHAKALQLPTALPLYPLVYNLPNTCRVFEEVVRLRVTPSLIGEGFGLL